MTSHLPTVDPTSDAGTVPSDGPRTDGPGTDGAGPARGVRSVRLGELDAGTVALGGRGATIVPVGHTGTRVSWWIGAEDRWHRPAGEPSTRDRLVDGTPVIESSVRIPSGDAVGRVTVGRVDGVDRPSVIVDVENASPIPVAFAYVVESDRRIDVDADGLVVDGVGVLTLTRPALGWAVAADAEALAEALAADQMTSDRPDWGRPGAVAVLVPLPHTAHAVATFTPGPAVDVEARRRLTTRDAVPTPERIVAGWSAHLAAGPRLDLPDGRHREALAAATSDVLLGPDRAGFERSGFERSGAVAAGLIVEALGRLGRVDDAGPIADLLDLQRPNGSMPGPDPVASTVQLVRAIAAWWAGGAATTDVENCLGALAEAARWLDGRRQRRAVSERAPQVAAALELAAATFADLDQPEVAAAVRRHVERLGRAEATVGTAAVLLAELGDGLAWGDAGSGDAEVPDVAVSARFVIATLDEVVRDRGDRFELLAGWRPHQAGAAVEAHEVPTRRGLVSFGLRWHGERPALLWEVDPWPQRASGPGPDTWSAPSVDPAWSTADAVGEALLAAPPGSVPVPAPDPSEPPEGGTFS